MEKRRTFAQESVLCASPCVRIKRESGANPDSPAAVMLRELSEKAPSPLATCLSWPGRFQKGGESEDLPFTKELFLLVG